MVSFMSATSARSSGVPTFSTALAFSRRPGWPIRNTSPVGMLLHDLRADQPYFRHGLLDHAPDVLERYAGCCGAAPGGRVHLDSEGGVGEFQLSRQRGLRHAGHSDHGRAVALQAVDLGLG